jgi:hypothetical protein
MPFFGQRHVDDATIVGRAQALAEALALETIEQARHRARVDLQFARQLGDGRRAALADHEQRAPLRVRQAMRLEPLVGVLGQREQDPAHQVADAVVRAVALGRIEAGGSSDGGGFGRSDSAHGIDNVHA